LTDAYHEPVWRQHQFGDGAVTELMDIDINMDEKLRQDFGAMNVGDDREFSLPVTVLIGYRPHQKGHQQVNG